MNFDEKSDENGKTVYGVNVYVSFIVFLHQLKKKCCTFAPELE